MTGTTTVIAGGVTTAPVLAGPAAAVPATAAAAARAAAPLEVTMDTLRPSTIPRRGEVIVTGEVTNRSQQTWRDLQAYLFMSEQPIGDRRDLAAAAASDPAAEVGQRLYREGQFTEVGDLEPGESSQYVVAIPRAELPITGEPGVYWIGIHVLGADRSARDLVADGRARAFIPLMEPDAAPTRLALALPLREQALRGPETRLLRLRHWERLLDTGGRLDRVLSFGASSTRPLTWLLDPAVLDAAASVAAGNPPLDPGDDGGPDADAEPAPPTASADGSGSPSVAPTPAEPAAGGDEDDEGPTLAQQAASAWLEAFGLAAERSTVMSLPYADVDVAAVTTSGRPWILRQAARLSGLDAHRYGYPARPVIAPPSGYLPARTLNRLHDGTPVLLRDEAMPGLQRSLLTRRNGVEVVLSDSAAGSGGPGPNDPGNPLAIRQRILAEAALRSLAADTSGPLVISLPWNFDPGPDWERSSFFAGLEVPWLVQVDLPTALARGGGTVDTSAPVYPRRERRAEVPVPNQLATEQLVGAGATYAELLARNDSVKVQVARAAMPASSYHARRDPDVSLTLTRRATTVVGRALAQVRLEGPEFVMMSSDTGPIDVTVSNGLDYPVTVRIAARSDSPELTVREPDPITLGPGQRAPVRMSATSSSTGLHSVTLQAFTEAGTPLGSSVRFNVRASNVGLVIWVVMGVGAALFLAAIALRVRRRVRTRKATHGPLLERVP